MRVFVAGGTGAVGRRLVPRLIAAGHDVVATTREPRKAERLRSLGAEPAVVDALDEQELVSAVVRAEPEAVVHELTALPRVANLRRWDTVPAPIPITVGMDEPRASRDGGLSPSRRPVSRGKRYSVCRTARSASAIAFSSASSHAAAVALAVLTSPLSCGRRSVVQMSGEPIPRLARMNAGWVLFD